VKYPGTLVNRKFPVILRRLSPPQCGTKEAVVIRVLAWLFVQNLLDLEIGSEIRMSGQIIKILVSIKMPGLFWRYKPSESLQGIENYAVQLRRTTIAF
uniref:Uncharacterized protein n=1 Tax=Catharus ustulatus TaxID=91951 RepID=A0A8C3VB05_CATUS